jgi:hypothetical protein
MWVQNTGTREPVIRKRTKPIPGDAMAVAPTVQSVRPQPDHVGPEGGDAGKIDGAGMIVHVAVHHAAKPLSHYARTGMHLTSQVQFDGLESGSKALGNGLASHSGALSITGPTTDMSKTEEIEGLRLALPQSATLGSRIGAKLDQAFYPGGGRERNGRDTS